MQTANTPSFLRAFPMENGVFLMAGPDQAFEEKYIRIRKKEGWLYSDEEVKQIPELKTGIAEHRRIWAMRKVSAARLLEYCNQQKRPLKILETGCGNGWFSHQLAACNPGFSVVGTDINFFELKQAARVFRKANLHFALADIFHSGFPENEFDLIVFNGSIQYFSDLNRIIASAKSLLNAKGEIHILDSPFYANENDAAAARVRTADYYQKLEAPEMAESYSHHLLKTLEHCGAELLYQPGKQNLFSRISGKKNNPFVWARIKKQA